MNIGSDYCHKIFRPRNVKNVDFLLDFLQAEELSYVFQEKSNQLANRNHFHSTFHCFHAVITPFVTPLKENDLNYSEYIFFTFFPFYVSNS